MSDTIDWLAGALARFALPDPREAPADAKNLLTSAFLGGVIDQHLVDDLTEAVRRASRGLVTLERREPELFPVRARGPAAYMAITGERYLLLTPQGAQFV